MRQASYAPLCREERLGRSAAAAKAALVEEKERGRRRVVLKEEKGVERDEQSELEKV